MPMDSRKSVAKDQVPALAMVKNQILQNMPRTILRQESTQFQAFSTTTSKTKKELRSAPADRYQCIDSEHQVQFLYRPDEA